MSTHGESLRPVSNEEYDRLLKGQLYSHQAAVFWDTYCATLPERELWQGTRWLYVDEATGEPRAALTMRCFSIHKMSFLWLQDGPIWIGSEPSSEEEDRFIRELSAFVKKNDHSVSFIRLTLFHTHDVAVMPCQDLWFHDTTVMIDLDGDEEALRSRMKPRGRQNVNKALRESPITVTEETNLTREDFHELFEIMEQTTSRQGFSALGEDRYWSLITTLRDMGACRLFVGRVDGVAQNWALFVIHNGFSTYEVAASTDFARKTRSPEKLLYHALLELQRDGVRRLDLVAVGSDYNPRLNSLNQFKTKWVKDVTYVGAPMEIVLKPARYRLMNGLAKVLGR